MYKHEVVARGTVTRVADGEVKKEDGFGNFFFTYLIF